MPLGGNAPQPEEASRSKSKRWRPALWQVVTGGVLALALLAAGATSAEATTAGPTVAPAAASANAEPLVGAAAFDPSFHHGIVQYSGGFLHYVRGGSGPVLILLPGWPETWYEFRNVMPALAQTHTVIAFDLPGLGTSSIPASGYDTKTVAARIHEATNNLGYAGNLAVIGHDWGAVIAYDWARDYPSEVSRILVADSPLPGFGFDTIKLLSFHLLLNEAPAPVAEHIIDDNADVSTYLGYLFRSASRHPELIAQSTYFTAYDDPARRTAGYEYYRAIPQDTADITANAGSQRLTLPVAAMGAQYAFGAGVAAAFQNVASDVRGIIAPDSGHWIPEENSQFFNACANLFFGPAGVTPPSPDLAGCAA
jgi:pimeloyl-ACP methyl ester carboxylesterase